MPLKDAINVNVPQETLTYSIETALMKIADRATTYEALIDALKDELQTVGVYFLPTKPERRDWVSIDQHGVRHQHLTEVDAIMGALQHYVDAKVTEGRKDVDQDENGVSPAYLGQRDDDGKPIHYTLDDTDED